MCLLKYFQHESVFKVMLPNHQMHLKKYRKVELLWEIITRNAITDDDEKAKLFSPFEQLEINR
jgi:hypothetical protein